MKIRSITAFCDVSYPVEPEVVAEAGAALQAARGALQAAGYEVQTTRLAVQPFPAVLASAGPLKAKDFAQNIEAVAFVHEIDYVSLGPVRMEDPPAFGESIPDILANTERVFSSLVIADSQNGISLPCIRRAAELILRISGLTPDGFANLRFAALANVPAWAPFFPAAYHGGGNVRLAVAVESADLALAAVSSAVSLADARITLTRLVENKAARIESALTGDHITGFAGIDFSLAPYPDETISIGAALERLGCGALGSSGSLLAAAFITGALDQSRFPRTGFSGLMLPVLEDCFLALRATEGILTVADLLLYSAVCGTGLDTIPLPGNISQDNLAALLVDVAALALRLDKPLTARLMPLPGKQAGDEADFEFEYFANGRVMAPKPGGLSGLLALNETIVIPALHPRPGAKHA
jgi:hypothetical protein